MWAPIVDGEVHSLHRVCAAGMVTPFFRIQIVGGCKLFARLSCFSFSSKINKQCRYYAVLGCDKWLLPQEDVYPMDPEGQFRLLLLAGKESQNLRISQNVLHFCSQH